jgi:hypothetical protein
LSTGNVDFGTHFVHTRDNPAKEAAIERLAQRVADIVRQLRRVGLSSRPKKEKKQKRGAKRRMVTTVLTRLKRTYPADMLSTRDSVVAEHDLTQRLAVNLQQRGGLFQPGLALARMIK